MARAILTGLLIVLLGVLVGCYSIDSGASQIISPSVKAAREAATGVQVEEVSEAGIVEHTALNRQAYEKGLEALVDYYGRTGSATKRGWAENELKRLQAVPQYNYIFEASVAGPDLRAKTYITEANYMFEEAVRTEEQAGALLLVKDENMLRLALERYNRLIRRHPSSDKIDDAAYRAGGICEYFRDYSIAALYYQRTFQWDPATIYPARFKAAYILDRYLHRRSEALELYKEAVEKESEYLNYKDYAERRIAELTASDELEE